jgi:hypothetical protein
MGVAAAVARAAGTVASVVLLGTLERPKEKRAGQTKFVRPALLWAYHKRIERFTNSLKQKPQAAPTTTRIACAKWRMRFLALTR